MTTWVPLVVAVVIALIAAVGSHMTARYTASHAARQELLAAKRVAYAQALADLDSGYADIARYGPKLAILVNPLSGLLVGPELSEEEQARLANDGHTRVSRALGTLRVLGGSGVQQALDHCEQASPGRWRNSDFSILAAALRQDLEDDTKNLGKGAIAGKR